MEETKPVPIGRIRASQIGFRYIRFQGIFLDIGETVEPKDVGRPIYLTESGYVVGPQPKPKPLRVFKQ